MPTIITRGAASALAYGWARITAILDPYFKYVTMLLPGNGTNGAQNNTFLDSSTNNFTITRNGNTTQGTFTPYGSNWSNYFDGSSTTGLQFPSAIIPTTGAFTLEAMIYSTASNASQCIFGQYTASTAGRFAVFWNDTANKFTVEVGGTVIITSTNTFSLNTWYYVAVTKTSGNAWTLYINGSSEGTASNSTTLQNTATIIGNRGGSGTPFYGYMSNVRISNTVRTIGSTISSPLTSDANTVALTCQSNRFIDTSSNAYAITVNGTPSVQRLSPFSPSAAYSTTTNGGSGYFDGTGDNLVSAASATLGLGSGAFTIEGWFYRTATGDRYLLDYGPESSNRISIIVFSNKLQVYDTGYRDSGLTVPLNQWNHFAIVRSGTTVTPYVNGVAGTTYTDSRNLAKTATWYVASDDTNALNITAYMTDVRIVVGTAVYTGAFTPPTAPLTAITNTKLLLNMTNAGIIDNAMMNDLETVGNAQISTTQSKFGGSSMYFDGTGDYLKAPGSQLYAYGTGDYTIEMWVRFGSVSTSVLVGNINGSGYGDWAFFYNSTSTVLRFIMNNNTVLLSSSSWTPSANTWYHVAICRASGTYRFFVDGTVTGSGSDTTNIAWTTANSILVGSANDGTLQLNGYIDDLRITKGYARYTANFTVPSSAFPTS